jgi:single-stranded-DNA-specific exonuclease
MPTWIEPQPVTLPAGFQDVIGGNVIVANRLFLNGYTQVDQALAFLDPSRYQPAPASDLPDLDLAAARLHQAIAAGQHICVWGDFDVDGQTSTTLLVAVLRDLGARVSYHIPVRATESHGINLPVLKTLLDGGAELLLTCDTGITAHDAIDYAQNRGVDVIVTDHHQLGPSLPDALAVINPQLLPPGHPLGTLPGVGVAYQLARQLYELAGRPEAAARQLDLVALGIVADVAHQTGDTRYLLQQGLEALRQPNRLGLQSLYARAETNPSHLTEEHIGFIIAPRLNALGRLSDANRIVDFLTTDDLSLARQEANFLEQLNNQRKLLTSQVYQGALTLIEQDPSLLDYACLVLNNPAWPAGVIGIVASRLVDRFGKPVILLSSPPSQPARGSARSIPGVNITAAISAHQALLAGFGGHPMAAGLSLEPDPAQGGITEQISIFRRRLSETIQNMTGGLLPEKTITLDSYLPLSELSLELVADLNRLAPFGPGNPAPVLACRNLTLLNQASLGREQEHRLLTVKAEDESVQRIIWWNGTGEPLPDGPFDLAFTVRASNFRGQEEVQVEWLDFRLLERPSPEVSPVRQITILDRRRLVQVLPLLAELKAETQAPILVWAEGSLQARLEASSRDQLRPVPCLAIASIPPGPQELQAALELVHPDRVILFGYDPGLDGLQPFIQRLLGLVKHAINQHAGQVTLDQLAAAMAHRHAAIQAGLELARQLGQIDFTLQSDGLLHFQRPSGRPEGRSGLPDSKRVAAQQHLQAILDETRAYRSYYLRADAQALIQPNTEI